LGIAPQRHLAFHRDGERVAVDHQVAVERVHLHGVALALVAEVMGRMPRMRLADGQPFLSGTALHLLDDCADPPGMGAFCHLPPPHARARP
jgi:hypothetical protein